MKILDVPGDSTIFVFGDINWNTRTEPISKSFEKACGSKKNFPKLQALWTGAYQLVWYGHNFPLNYLECIL